MPFLTNALTEDYREFLGLRATPLAMLSKFEEAHFGWDHALAAPAWHTLGGCRESSSAAFCTTMVVCRS